MRDDQNTAGFLGDDDDKTPEPVLPWLSQPKRESRFAALRKLFEPRRDGAAVHADDDDDLASQPPLSPQAPPSPSEGWDFLQRITLPEETFAPGDFGPLIAAPIGLTDEPSGEITPEIRQSYQDLRHAVEHNHAPEEQQQTLERYRAVSASLEFECVAEYERDGCDFYVWDDPRHRGDAAYRVIYQLDRQTGHFYVYAGPQAQAAVTADAGLGGDAPTGVQILEFRKGQMQALGDEHNVIDAKESFVAEVDQIEEFSQSPAQRRARPAIQPRGR